MKIVVVDHVYLEAKHIRETTHYGNLRVFKDPPIDTKELKNRIREADIVIVGWSNLMKTRPGLSLGNSK